MLNDNRYYSVFESFVVTFALCIIFI